MRLRIGGFVCAALLFAGPIVSIASAQADTPDVEVAGIQTSADDARQPGEVEPFIINDGFGD